MGPSQGSADPTSILPEAPREQSPVSSAQCLRESSQPSPEQEQGLVPLGGAPWHPPRGARGCPGMSLCPPRGEPCPSLGTLRGVNKHFLQFFPFAAPSLSCLPPAQGAGQRGRRRSEQRRLPGPVLSPGCSHPPSWGGKEEAERGQTLSQAGKGLAGGRGVRVGSGSRDAAVQTRAQWLEWRERRQTPAFAGSKGFPRGAPC